MAWVKTAGTAGTAGYKRSVAGEAAMSPSQAESRGYHWEPQKKSFRVSGRGKEEPTEREYAEILERKVRRGHYKDLTLRGRISIEAKQARLQFKTERIETKYGKYIVGGVFGGSIITPVLTEWADHLKDGVFTGTKSEYGLFQTDIQRAESAVEYQYGRYTSEARGLGTEYAAMKKDIDDYNLKIQNINEGIRSKNETARLEYEMAGKRWTDAQNISMAAAMGLRGGPTPKPLDINVFAPYGGIKPLTWTGYSEATQKFEARWKPVIKPGVWGPAPYDVYPEFVGSEQQFQKYKDEYSKLIEQRKDIFWGIPSKYERFEERGGEAIAARTPTWEEATKPFKPFVDISRQVVGYERRFGIPSMTMGAVYQREKIVSPYVKAIYEGIREKPVKTAVITAAYFALGKVLPAGKYAFKPVAKVGVKAFPRAAPWIGKWTPRAVAVGLGTAYGADIGRRVYAAPPQMRIEEFGKITGTELLPMGLGTAAGLKAISFKIRPVPKPRMPTKLNIEKIMAKIYRDARIAQSKYIPRKYRVPVRKARAVRDIPYVRGVEGYMAKIYRDARIAQSKYIPRKYRVPVRRKPESELSKAMRDFGTFMRSRRGGVVLAPSKPKIPKLKEKPVWEVPELVPRRGIGGREILMGKEPYVPKVEPYKYEDITRFEGFEKPARGRIEISEGKSRLEIVKEISETTDIARIKALEAKLAGSRPVSRKGQQVEDWGEIWKTREVETAKRITAGELQVQELAGGELGLLQITKTVKVPKIKTIEAARKASTIPGADTETNTKTEGFCCSNICTKTDTDTERNS
ncbi:MAG: hypothetical protein JJE19_07465 [Methanosarcinales archaeon]|nr:hypothetical protein [Methanosarcinales archaeon]